MLLMELITSFLDRTNIKLQNRPVLPQVFHFNGQALQKIY
jgi:hypothetical protein